MIHSRPARRTVLAVAAGLLLAGFGSAPALAAPAAPAPSGVAITGITYGGTGCPAGSVAQSIAGDGSAFTLVFDSFLAESGPGVPPDRSRRSCQVNVNLTAPAGWSWAVGELTTDGYVDIPANATAESMLTAYAGGQPFPAQRRTFTGTYRQNYTIRSVSPVTNLNWSACGGTGRVSLNQQLRLSTSSPGTVALATLDSMNGKITRGPGQRSDAKIVWTRCSN